MPTHKVEIHPADAVPRGDLLAALNASYADYFVPIHLSSTALDEMLRREAIDLSDSRVAVVAGTVVGMGLMGVRGAHGWIGGMGVVPAHRRTGIGRQLMESLLASASSLGLVRLQLEVITRNTGALKLYEMMGFETRRRLLVLNRKADAPAPDMPGTEVARIKPVRPAALLDVLKSLPAPERPWQRQHASGRAGLKLAAGLAAYQNGSREPVGACLYRGSDSHRELVDVAALTPQIGAALLHRLISGSPASAFSYLNVADDDPLLPTLLEMGFAEMIDQYEMLRSLPGNPSS